MWWTSLYVKQTTQHNMWWTSLYTMWWNYTNNTTQYVVDITIHKQTTQHNMWWTSLYINKQHNTICGGPHYT